MSGILEEQSQAYCPACREPLDDSPQGSNIYVCPNHGDIGLTTLDFENRNV